MLSAVVATATAASFRGNEPAIQIPQYKLEHAAEIPLYALLGVVCAIVAVIFIHLLYWAEDRFDEFPFPPKVMMPVLGGLLVGLLALVNSGVLGLGEGALDSALHEESGTRTLLSLAVLKLAATSITIGSGGSGGVFRPSLFLGAMVGGAFGALAHGLLPSIAGTSGGYATVGMAAMFAGAARAPITSILIIFEMTRDYAIILPLMTSVVISTFISQLLSPGTVYTIKLARRGVHIDDETEQPDVMRALRVADAMTPVRAAVEADTPLSEVIDALRGDADAAALVLDAMGRMQGIITNVDLNEAIAAGVTDRAALAIASRQLHTVFPDQTLHEALAVFGQHSVHTLPVVTREDRLRPVGVLRRVDITQAYAAAAEGRDSSWRRRRLARAASGDEVRYLELRVRPGSLVEGQLLLDLDLDVHAVIVAVRHDGSTLIPRGHTRLEAGDRVTVIAAVQVADTVRARFEQPAPPR